MTSETSPKRTSSQLGTATMEPLVNDLIDKETQYIEQLRVLKNYYLVKLMDDFPGEIMNELNNILSSLIDIHSRFLSSLNRHMESRDIGESFIENRDNLRLYAILMSKILIFQSALNDMINSDNRVREAITTIEGQCSLRSITLAQLLERPEARIREYLDLLVQLKTLNPGNLELFELAEEPLKEVSANIEKIRADQLISQKIVRFQNKINRLPCDRKKGLTGYGRIITEGRVIFKFSSEPSESEQYLILFDKIILICKPIGTRTFEYNGCLIVNDFTCYDSWPGPVGQADNNNATTSRRSPSNSPKTQGDTSNPPSPGNEAHQVFLKHNHCGCIHTITFESDSLKRDWIESFQKALDNGNPSPCRIGDCKHGFLQKSYPINTPCDLCHKIMLGNIYQGYCCFKCSVNVHKECIGKKNLKRCRIGNKD